jgi:hypothetical protein
LAKFQQNSRVFCCSKKSNTQQSSQDTAHRFIKSVIQCKHWLLEGRSGLDF